MGHGITTARLSIAGTTLCWFILMMMETTPSSTFAVADNIPSYHEYLTSSTWTYIGFNKGDFLIKI